MSAAVLTLGPHLSATVAGGDIITGEGSGDGLDNQGTVTTTGSLSVWTGAFSNEGTMSAET